MSMYALLLLAPERRAQQAVDTIIPLEGMAEATQLLQQLFFLQHYQSFLSGHSQHLPNSRKSTCSYFSLKNKMV